MPEGVVELIEQSAGHCQGKRGKKPYPITWGYMNKKILFTRGTLKI